MIAAAIIAVLAAFALPSYQNHVAKAQVREAQNNLVALSLVVESLYQRQLRYISADIGNSVNSAANLGGWLFGLPEAYGYSPNADLSDIEIQWSLRSRVCTDAGKFKFDMNRDEDGKNTATNVKWEKRRLQLMVHQSLNPKAKNSNG